MAGEDLLLVGGDTLYQLVLETQQVIPRLRLAQGEVLVSATTAGQSVGVVSDRALYVYDGKALRENHAFLAPRIRVPMPGKIGDLRNLELISVDDGYLVCFLYSARSASPVGTSPFQIVLRAHEDGRIEMIRRRGLRFDYPALFRYRAWWISPALYTVRHVALDPFAPPQPLRATDPAPIPRAMWWLAASLSILSLLAAVWLTVRASVSRSARLAWISACGVIGLPAVLSLWLMVRRRERASHT